MRNTIISAVSALFLLLAGVLVINWQLWHVEKLTTASAAGSAVEKMNAILTEVAGASQTARRVMLQGCTNAGQLGLATEAALRPHIRAITIVEKNGFICTSLPGNNVLIVHPETLPDEKLMLLSADRLINGGTILIVQQPITSGRVLISVSDVYLRDVITGTSQNSGMALVVGKQMIRGDGTVSVYPPDNDTLTLASSASFPFSMAWQPPAFFSLARLQQQGWSLILLVLFLSVTVGMLLRRYLTNNTTFEDDLRKGIIKGEIVPYYQPIVNGETGALYGVEVLARWKHPKSGFIPPDVFIPIAERSGLIIPLTKGLMASVVSQLKPLLPKLPDDFHIGVNISARHIKSPSFINDCSAYGEGFQGEKVKLILEITEREPLIDNPHLIDNLNALHNAGFVIALDDFGTGYSGLSCLNELAIDYIKIDKSFVNGVSAQKDSTILLDCVIDLARKLSLSIVAEGVETKEQLDYLNRNKITLLQGYYFGKPVSYIDFVKVLLSKPREEVMLNTVAKHDVPQA